MDGFHVIFSNFSLIEEISNSDSEDVLSIVLPDSSEVRLVKRSLYLFMRIDQIFLGEKLGSELAHCLVFFLELGSALWGSRVNTENEFVLLIGSCE